MLCLLTVASFGERLLIPYNMVFNLKLESKDVGILYGIAGLSAFLFPPISSAVYKKVVAKYTMMFFISFYLIFLVLNAF